MIVVSVCKYKLHEEEFVRPVVEIVSRVEDVEVVRIDEELDFKGEKVIVCGTALKDFEYLKKDVSWIKKCKSYLGICSGYQMLAKAYSLRLERIEKIGVYEVKNVRQNGLTSKKKFKAYFLHELAIPEKKYEEIEILSICGEVAAFKVKEKNFYGVSFHPEVLNPEVIENFLAKKI